MPSVTVTRKDNAAVSVSVAVDTHKDEIAEAYAETVAPILKPGEKPADVASFQSQVGRLIAWRGDQAVLADEAHIDELSDDAAALIEREGSYDEVRGGLIDIGALCRAVYGPKLAAEIVVAEDGVSEVPKTLFKQASHTLKRLSDPELRLPRKKRLDVDFDPRKLAKRLRPGVRKLGEAIRRVEREKREAESTLSAKHDALEKQGETYQPGLKLLEGLFAFVGKRHLAQRLRPPVLGRRRSPPRGEGEVPEPATAQAGATPDAEPPTAESPTAESTAVESLAGDGPLADDRRPGPSGTA